MLDEDVIGSLPQGFAAGFCCGIIGLILVLVMAKGGETKKGAIIGFISGIVVGVLANCIFFILGGALG